jgi:serine phosphatase RsbU (regulator of sigma subunit)
VDTRAEPPGSWARWLAALGRDLGDPAGAAEVLRLVAERCVPRLADWAIADEVTQPDLIRRVAVVGTDPTAVPGGAEEATLRRSGTQARGLLAGRLAAHRRDALELDLAQLRAVAGAGSDARSRTQARLALDLGAVSLRILPLGAGGRTHGVLTLGRRENPFDDHDRAVSDALAELTGLALDRVWLRDTHGRVAARLQAALLAPLGRLPGLATAARYRPADRTADVGGDWYDAFPMGSDAALVIGDVAGHDLAAAAAMGQLRTLLRAVAVQRPASPERVLARLDRVLTELDSDLLASCLLARVSAGPGGLTLRWSSAGHLPPLLLRDGQARLLTGQHRDLLLGVATGAARHATDTALHQDDVLVLYTDGLVESRLTSLDVGLDRLLEHGRALAVAAAGAEQVCDTLLAELGQPDDDVAILAARVGAET